MDARQEALQRLKDLGFLVRGRYIKPNLRARVRFEACSTGLREEVFDAAENSWTFSRTHDYDDVAELAKIASMGNMALQYLTRGEEVSR